ncbi:MAG: YbaB/EbfC family nucleoid-associated protein [Candidatus Acidiferrales bacterium]
MGLADMQKMLGQMREMQEQVQQKLAQMKVEASAGGGMVSVKMNGHKQLLEVKIDPELATGGDRELLQDLVLAAVNEAGRLVDAELQQQVMSLAGPLAGLKLPGIF